MQLRLGAAPATDYGHQVAWDLGTAAGLEAWDGAAGDGGMNCGRVRRRVLEELWERKGCEESEEVGNLLVRAGREQANSELSRWRLIMTSTGIGLPHTRLESFPCRNGPLSFGQ